MKSKCPNCGGALRFDIRSQRVVCDYCDSTFDPKPYIKELATDNAAKEIAREQAKEWNVSVFTCPNCGGELMSEDLDAIDYCPYCGSFVTLESHLRAMDRPKYIIPFKKTAEECRESYRKRLRTKIYAPREFRDEKYLQNFKSIYLPYWLYNYSYGPSGSLSRKTSHREGDYIVSQDFDIGFDLQGSANGVPFDASSSFDDTISARIAPFDPVDLEPFHDAAMFGAFADTADIDKTLYFPDAEEVADNALWKKVESIPEIRSQNPDDPEFGPKKAPLFGRKLRSANLAMLPVWFLTWRKKDRVAYSVMNGQTGEISAEVPISLSRFFLFSLILAVPLFFLFQATLTLTAPVIMLLAAILTSVAAWIYMSEFTEIARRMAHAGDKGYLFVHKDEKEAAEKLNKGKKKKKGGSPAWGIFLHPWAIISAVFILYSLRAIVVAVLEGFAQSFAGGSNVSFLWYGVTDIFLIIAFIRLLTAAGAVRKTGQAILGMLGCLIAIVAVHLIYVINPVSDLYYYAGAILALAGILSTVVIIVTHYNALITRPVPHFFDRAKKN